MLDTSEVIVNTVERLYDVGQLASLGYGDITAGSMYRAAASSTLIPAGLGILKMISLAVSVLLIFLIIRVVAQLRGLSAGIPVPNPLELPPIKAESIPKPAQGGWVMARWGEITRHMESPKESEWRFAIIEADKLADEVLKRAGYAGDGMGDRLMNIQPGQLETLEGLWEAHKVRNRVAHDLHYFLRYTEAKRTIGQFESTLHELQLL